MKKIYFLLFLILGSSLGYGQLLFNEVCYDPSNNALDGDANGDGVYDQDQDEFLEIYNSSNTNFDLSGYEVWDDSAGSSQYVFPAGSLIPPNGVLVLFGGGTPTGYFGGAIVLSDTDGLSFTNSGEKILLRDNSGNTVLVFDSDALSNNPNESYTLYPDVTGILTQHNDSTPLLFSPGTKVDGTPFDTVFVVSSLHVEGEGGQNAIPSLGATLQMVANAAPVIADDTSVTWSLTSGSANATISPAGLLTAVAKGTVTVVATANDKLGVSDSTVITISDNPIGINEVANGFHFDVYPNPASGQLRIVTNEKISQLDVYTLQGRNVMTENGSAKTLDVTELPAGVYVLKASGDTGVATVRFIRK